MLFNELVKKSGKTMTQISKEAGVSIALLSKFYHGKELPSKRAYAKLVAYFNCDEITFVSLQVIIKQKDIEIQELKVYNKKLFELANDLNEQLKEQRAAFQFLKDAIETHLNSIETYNMSFFKLPSKEVR